MRNRRGFTIIEMLVVFVVVAILLTIATLRYMDLRNQAETSRVASDLHAIRLAAYNYWYEKEQWPAENVPGIAPPELESNLPSNFQFTKPNYTLDWDNIPSGGGSPLIGVSVSSADSRLMATLARNLGRRLPYIMVGNTLTYIIVGPDGRI